MIQMFLKTLGAHSKAQLVAVAVALLVPTVTLAQRQSVPTPTIIGPIPALGSPGTDLTHNYPQLASEPNFNLSQRGYLEEEFFFQGYATRYQTPAMANGTVLSTGHPYKSRLIVRRPLDPGKFNGVVIVEWVNVTSGYNLDVHWQASRDYLTREGYAYVGVSAQRVGVQQPPAGLTSWSPTRYGDLDVTAGGAITDDSLSYDIFSQAAQALRGARRADLLGRLRPRTLIAVGASQSASRLTPYYNSIHPLHRIFDGFLLHVGGGAFRTDLREPLLRINSENEIVRGQASVRQPDSAVFRSWEIAGASHVDYWFQAYRQTLIARDGLPPFNYACDPEPLSHVSNKYVLNAGYQQLVDWIQYGRQPSVATPIDVTSLSPVTIPRDANGHVFGGIRLAAVEVPTATNTGANRSTAAFCVLYGSHEPFGASKLAELYPTHATYVQAVREVTLKNVNDGFVLKEDAEEIIRDARTSVVGTSHPLPIP